MCPLWGLCCGLSPVRQSGDELSVYSHPVRPGRVPVLMGHTGANSTLGRSDGIWTRDRWEKDKDKKEINWSKLEKSVECYYIYTISVPKDRGCSMLYRCCKAPWRKFVMCEFGYINKVDSYSLWVDLTWLASHCNNNHSSLNNQITNLSLPYKTSECFLIWFPHQQDNIVCKGLPIQFWPATFTRLIQTDFFEWDSRRVAG